MSAGPSRAGTAVDARIGAVVGVEGTDVSDDPVDAGGEDLSDRPTPARIAAGVGGVVAILLLVWGAAHVVVPPVDPRQAAPAGHYTAPCWTCHIVSESAPPVEDR